MGERRGDALPAQRLRAVGGFDPRIFMYGEDVDLSWRLRARGWRLRYLPARASCTAPTRAPGEVKPLQVFGGVLTNLCLRARYGGAAAHAAGPRDAGGRDARAAGLSPGGAGASSKACCASSRAGRISRCHARAADGTLPARCSPAGATRCAATARSSTFRSQRESAAARHAAGVDPDPHRRTAARGCAQALESCAQPDLAEPRGGRDRGRPADARERGRRVSPTASTIRYRATGERVGRARAGNLALADARGEWLNFLDDDDVLFADHVEVLVDAVDARRGARAPTRSRGRRSTDVPRPRARAATTRSCTSRATASRFDRLDALAPQLPADPGGALPPQPLRAPRRLRRGHGPARGLEPVDALHARGRLRAGREDDVQVPRARQHARAAAARQALLDGAYRDAVERQQAMRVHALAARRSRRWPRTTSAQPVGGDGHAAATCAASSARSRVARAARRVARPLARRVLRRRMGDADERGCSIHRRALHPRARRRDLGRALAPLPLRRALVAGKRVLDVACGEGYGTALLARARRARHRRGHLARRDRARASAPTPARQRRASSPATAPRCRSPTRQFDVSCRSRPSSTSSSRRRSSTSSRACWRPAACWCSRAPTSSSTATSAAPSTSST